jgi:hypothetical protein
MRWACHAIADRVGAGHPDDTLYLFWGEIMDVSAGRRPYAGLRDLVQERKQYFDYWLERRPPCRRWSASCLSRSTTRS